MKEEILTDNGERLLPEMHDANAVMHWHRYAFAAGLCRGKDVLDIASGEGYGSNLMSGAAKSVTGVDISAEAVANANAKYNSPTLRFLQGSAAEIPLEDASVDVAVSFETIEHHDKHEEMLGELKRVLRPDGLLVISTPDKAIHSERLGLYNAYHVKELYREEFHSLVKKYFANMLPMAQKLVYGSLVAPEDEAEGFGEYWDDKGETRGAGSIRMPWYLVCLASDVQIPRMPSSFYDGWPVLEAEVEAARQYGVDSVVSSRPYRLGRMLTWPARVLFGRQNSAG